MIERIKALSRNIWFWIVLGLVLVAGGWQLMQRLAGNGLPSSIAYGNGRMEAVAIDIAARIPGRIKDILVQEGDAVNAGQVLAHMDTLQLDAQLREARAQLQRSRIAREVAQSGQTQREAEHSAALAVLAQRTTELAAAERRLQRSEQLAQRDAVSLQVLDDDRTRTEGAKAARDAARAQVAATEAGIATARAQIVDAEAAIEATQATIERIEADINDSALRSPRSGRVQYRVAQPGEVIAAGGRVLNLIDLHDVYMTFFLPTAQAGRIALGMEARIVLDAAPKAVVPATVSFLSDVAQFTPKTVETAAQRQDLMFRVRVRVPPELLEKYSDYVKPGLPGVAYVKLDRDTPWPESLAAGLLQ